MTSLYTKVCSLMLLFSCCCGAGAIERRLDVLMKLDDRHDLQQHCFGANCLLIGRPIWYDHSSFIDRFEEAGTPFFRFPGGTPANFYNPFKGINDVVPESGRDYERKNREILRDTNGKGQTPNGFFRFAKKTGAQYSVVLNMSTLSVEENKEWLTEAKRNGADIAAFELGNELYFGSYKWAFPEPEDYLACAKETTAMLRRLYPKAKVGILVPSHIYTDESFLSDNVPPGLKRQEEWMELIEGEDFYDSIVVHLYNTVGMDGKTKRKDFLPYPEAYQHALAHMNFSLDSTLQLLEERFPEKTIWITEYGLGGFSGELRGYKLRGSQLGGLVSSLMLLEYFKHSSVEVSSWHSFSHFFDFVGGKQGLGEHPHLLYHHFKLFAEPANDCQFYVPLKIKGQAMREGSRRHPMDYPDVEGGGFINRDQGYVILVNKLDQSYSLGSVTPLYKGKKRPLSWVEGLQLQPRIDLDQETALRDQDEITQTVLSGNDLEKIVLPPYSITRLKFEWK